LLEGEYCQTLSPRGRACVAAAAEQNGHEVSFLDLILEDDPRSAVEKKISIREPDIIGVSVRNIDDQNRKHPTFFLDKVKETIASCRRLSQAPIVLGGAGYSIFPKASLDYLGADMGIQGEGEHVFVELLKRIELGIELSGLPGLYLRGHNNKIRRSFIPNLGELNLPDAEMLSPYLAGFEELWLPVQTRRGCFMRCSYCSTGTIEGFELRKRSPDIVVERLSQYADAGFHRIYFVDNNFSIPKSHGLQICREMTKRKLDITWRCILNPMQVDEELVAAMAEAGCKEVSIGFESGCERILKSMNKHFTLEDICRTAGLLKNHGIRRMGFLLLGGPGEMKESVQDSFTFAESLNLESLRVTAGIRIYPQTPLAEYAIEEGVISPDDNLLFPRFYFVKELEGWIDDVMMRWKEKHPEWVM
jgi:radical SAM superfamily enzyme YgiQ (UPF0313 family)